MSEYGTALPPAIGHTSIPAEELKRLDPTSVYKIPRVLTPAELDKFRPKK